MATAFPIDGIVIDRGIAANLHRQLYSQLRGLIERRVLPSGTALPSTRLLTKDLARRPQHRHRRLRTTGA